MAKKIKGFSGNKRCPDGDMYRFKNGVASVKGMYIERKQAKISFGEFKIMCKEIVDNREESC